MAVGLEIFERFRSAWELNVERLLAGNAVLVSCSQTKRTKLFTNSVELVIARMIELEGAVPCSLVITSC
jgi:hypothetical protein